MQDHAVAHDHSVALSTQQRTVAGNPAHVRAIVQAGPGTGKTETVAHRLVALLSQGVRPAQILTLSFSRNAVRTLTERVARLRHLSAEQAEELRYLSVRTFDSWAFRILRQLNHSPATLLRGSHDENIDLLIKEFRGERREAALRRLAGIRHIIVDEFQDLSGVRGALVLELLEMLAAPERPGVGFTVLGDPAQAIYAFAVRNGQPAHAALSTGALIETIRKTYGTQLETYVLEQNYRATGQLGSVATNLRRLLLRPTTGATKLDALRKIVSRVRIAEDSLRPSSLLNDEFRTAAVLTTTNGEAIRVAQKLQSYGAESAHVILHTASRPKVVPPWIGATLGPLRSQTLSRTQFQRIYAHYFENRPATFNVPPVEDAWRLLVRAFDAAPSATALDVSILRSRLEWADLLPDDDGALAPGIHVMTIHQAKGMEFDAVALMPESLMQREFGSDDEHHEAANVLFVGMTRAAKQLVRVEEGQTFGPMYPREHDGRIRWHSFLRGWANVEIGSAGDVDPLSFIDRRFFSDDGRAVDETQVRSSQEYLAENALELTGRKVMLCQWKMPDTPRTRYRYRIHLQEGDAPGRVLGATTEVVTRDLLQLLSKKGYWLPRRIFNLRISDVVTLALSREAAPSLALPYARSGLWLGVNIYGSGDFPLRGSSKTRRRG